LRLEYFIRRKFAFRVLHAFNETRPHVFDAMTADENHPEFEDVGENETATGGGRDD
jgi:hypothetical protein